MPKRVHFPSLDGIRAFAILLVVLSHTVFFYPMPVSGPFGPIFHSGPLLASGQIGVKIFFCLSGYLITRLLLIEEADDSRIDLRAFYERRAVRILPIAFIYILTILSVFGRRLPTSEYISAFLFLQDFRPHFSWLLAHLWSLSVEQQFYLFWPLVFLLKARRLKILIATFCAVQVINLALYKLHFFLYGNAFYSVADTIAAGCAVAILRDHPFVQTIIGARWFRAVPALSIISLVMFFRVSSAHFNYPYILARTIITPLCYFGIAASIHYFVERPAWVLNLRWIRYLGKISYSMYIWQQLITYVELSGTYERFGIWVDVPIVWAVILLVSIVSYEFLEKPSFKLRRFIRQPRRVTMPA